MQQLQLDPFDRTWASVVTDYRVLTEKDKVRKNTWDDYGLGPDYHFMSGSHVDLQTPRPRTVWHSLYVRLPPELIEQIRPHMCDGWVGGIQPVSWGARGVQLIAKDRLCIAHVHVCRLLDAPADLAIFNDLATIACVPRPVTDGPGV